MKLNVPSRTIIAAISIMLFMPALAPAQSLKSIPVPAMPELWKYIRNKPAAIQLGKALFWDMQVGSDGQTACATCHFHAGTDNRTRNTLNPGENGGDTVFHGASGPNSVIAKANFPFTAFSNPQVPNPFTLINDSNDAVGSQGVRKLDFVDINLGNPVDSGTPVVDTIFNVGGTNVRQVTGRNTPTVINAVYNFANFWDGRANNVYNGVNPFGAMDPNAVVFVQQQTGLTAVQTRIRNGALASQAMGPPLSSVEMSWNGRSWPKIGKKMMSLRPLNLQVVHPHDSALGTYSRARFKATGQVNKKTGLFRTYDFFIRKAFVRKYWKITDQHLEFVDVANPDLGLQIVAGAADPLDTNQFTQMEANFNFFFGMAVQAYLSTLVSDESPFDKYMFEVAALGFSNTLSEEQQIGLGLFNGVGACAVCHGGPEFTGASVGNVLANPNPPIPGVPNIPDPRENPLGAMEMMPFTIGDALYDVDFLNVHVTRPTDDIGRAGTSPFNNPLTGANYPLGWSELALLKRDNLLPNDVAEFTPSLPLGFLSSDTSPGNDRVASIGAFKSPSLRNVSLTGPYFHNGGMSTLMQVVDFYSRGGNFPTINEADKPVEISPIPTLRGDENQQRFLVEFLESLTDPRVAEESGPFDHPQLMVPHGVDPLDPTIDIIDMIPPVGILGRYYEMQQILTPFLDVDHLVPEG